MIQLMVQGCCITRTSYNSVDYSTRMSWLMISCRTRNATNQVIRLIFCLTNRHVENTKILSSLTNGASQTSRVAVRRERRTTDRLSALLVQYFCTLAHMASERNTVVLHVCCANIHPRTGSACSYMFESSASRAGFVGLLRCGPLLDRSAKLASAAVSPPTAERRRAVCPPGVRAGVRGDGRKIVVVRGMEESGMWGDIGQ